MDKGWRRRWAAPAAVTALAGLLRFWRLGSPAELMFDETYYVKDAYSLLTRGVEFNWVKDTDALFEAGDFSSLQDTGAYIAHPPVGKWLIAGGMSLFGPESPVGWRFSTALCGTAAVFLTILVGWRLFNSQTLGLLAGLAVAVDGIGLVLSRTALLDVFLMFFALLGFWLVLKDRAVMERRLKRRLGCPVGHGPTGAPLYDRRLLGPGLGMRWYLLGAGLALGLACGVKWSGLFFLAVFGLLAVVWDAASRRRAGVRGWLAGAVLRDGPKAFGLMVPTALAVYTASWAGWLATKTGYNRNWAEQHPGEGVGWLPAPLRSLLEYHRQVYGFHTTLTSEHNYASNPAWWLIQQRSTSFFYESEPTCGADSCSQAVTALGNPLIWWLGVVALGAVIYNAIVWADRRAWGVLAGYIGGYLPWLFYAQRTIFTFYTVAFLPFVGLALAYAAGRAIGPPLLAAPREAISDLDDAVQGSFGAPFGQRFEAPFGQRIDPPAPRRVAAITAVAVLTGAALVLTAFYWPIWSGQSVPHLFWQLHMWLPSWI
ncbi:MAG: phospholipid carrier-dependent glycosyltransferase [Bifidobacteriaceae bacterium]|nr:phospholipid carrier-dependent glycosyltransferase [Bifidobacteriaceae bacterium]